MKKLAGLKKVLDGINQLSSQTEGPSGNEDSDLNDSLRPGDFTLAKVNRFGFPYHATCLAIDHVQRLIAIGTASGAIRICGKPGVEFHIHHESNASVTILSFLINEGGLVSVCNDATLHIWSLRQNQPALIQSLNFRNSERISALHNPFGSKWLYVGTERGNIFMVHVETFHISGYVISWNHVIDVSSKTHPGPCIEIKSNPQDQNKILLNFESGVCVLWDLRSRKVLHSYTLEKPTQYVTCTSWHTEGKQFMTGHWDGQLSTWNYKNPKKTDERSMPHGTSKSKEDSICCPIIKLEWLAGKVGEFPLVIFSGGMPYGNKNKGLTIMKGRSKSLLLSEQVVDFKCLFASPVPTECPEAQALFVLLKNEIVVFDLLGSIAPSLPWFELPYCFDIHESPITCIEFISECPNALLTVLHSLNPQNHRRDKGSQANQSKRAWPLNGGQEGELTQVPSIIITGHVDGSVKFWDSTSSMLILCHKFSVSRLFDRNVSRQSSTTSSLSKSSTDHYDDPFAIQNISFCPYGRVMAVSCQSHFVAVFEFSAKESVIETTIIDVNFCVEIAHEADSPTSLNDSLNGGFNDASIAHSVSQQRLTAGIMAPPYHPPFRTIGVKWHAGFQPVCVCQQLAYEPMPVISALSLSSAYGLMAFGNSIGLAVIDYVQHVTVVTTMSYELGVPGEWTDASCTPHTPLNKGQSSNSSNEKDPFSLSNGYLEAKHDRHDSKRDHDKHSKRKERISRVTSANVEQLAHTKLSKKSSVNSTGSLQVKDKEDGVLPSRERMTSSESTLGSIHTLSFAYAYTRKGANLVCPSLWAGSSTGCLAVIALSVPSAGEQRTLQPVLSLCTGTSIEHKYCILNITHLDKSGNICVSPFKFWKDGASPNPAANRLDFQTINSESTSKTFVCIVTEKQIHVKSLPSFKVHSTVDDAVSSDGFIVKASPMQVDGGNCIGCLTTDGSVKIYSLPNLRLLLDVECGISINDYRMIRTFNMGNGGEAAFLTSPTEIQMVAFTKEKERMFIDDHGCLFTMRQTPAAKAKGFLESFLSAPASTLDREELFGPKSGATRKVADYVPGSGMESLRNQTDTAAGAISRAKMALIERGDKLEKLDERTQEMMAKAQNFSSAARALAEKYQKKKWYQL